MACSQPEIGAAMLEGRPIERLDVLDGVVVDFAAAAHRLVLSERAAQPRRGRGRNSPSPCGLGLPRAQIPACGTTALGSYLRYERRSAVQGMNATLWPVAAIELRAGSSAPR